MTGIDVARAVVEQKECHLARVRKSQTIGEPIQYDCKPTFTGSHKGWFYVDLFSASAIVAVYDALNDVNKAKYSRLSLPRMATVAFKVTA
jgi:predicted RNase H-like nuclease